MLAIWGRETAYGKAKLPHYAVRALTTQAFMGRRTEKFREELLLALGILQEGHITREAHAQLLGRRHGPTRSSCLAISGITRWTSTVTGGATSGAPSPTRWRQRQNFLKQNGWQKGKAWGYEVRLPDGFDCTLEGITNAQPIKAWLDLGITRTFDRKFRPDRLTEMVHLMAPAGTLGPAFSGAG